MKKLFALLACLTLLTASALAETDLSGYAIANGTVTAVRFVDLTAPYSGTLLPFDLSAGDRVNAGDELFSMMLSTVYAPEAGTVTLFGEPGDDASGVIAHYGALASLETEIPTQVLATTASAYNVKENHILYVGETLDFRSSGSRPRGRAGPRDPRGREQLRGGYPGGHLRHRRILHPLPERSL